MGGICRFVSCPSLFCSSQFTLSLSLSNVPSGASTTHIFASNLSGSKSQKVFEAKKKNHAKLVTPEWAIECAKKGRKVCESRFMVRIGDEVRFSSLPQSIPSGAHSPARRSKNRPTTTSPPFLLDPLSLPPVHPLSPRHALLPHPPHQSHHHSPRPQSPPLPPPLTSLRPLLPLLGRAQHLPRRLPPPPPLSFSRN
jgi:hypothetical protein